GLAGRCAPPTVRGAPGVPPAGQRTRAPRAHGRDERDPGLASRRPPGQPGTCGSTGGGDQQRPFRRSARRRPHHSRPPAPPPRPPQAAHRPPTLASSHGLYTPKDTKAFGGQSDSAATCPYSGGCAPPDTGLATSGNYEVQVVNTAIDIWKNGVAVAGFPKSLRTFFAVPSPSPAGC